LAAVRYHAPGGSAVPIRPAHGLLWARVGCPLAPPLASSLSHCARPRNAHLTATDASLDQAQPAHPAVAHPGVLRSSYQTTQRRLRRVGFTRPALAPGSLAGWLEGLA